MCKNSFNLFDFRSKDGHTGTFQVYKGGFKFNVFAPKNANSTPSGPIQSLFIPLRFLELMQFRCKEILKETSATETIVLTKFDPNTRKRDHIFTANIVKETGPDVMYSLVLNFLENKFSVTFPFEIEEYVICTSCSEKKKEESAHRFKNFIICLNYDNLLYYKYSTSEDKTISPFVTPAPCSTEEDINL